jgi:excisionase family DNA binding protein
MTSKLTTADTPPGKHPDNRTPAPFMTERHRPWPASTPTAKEHTVPAIPNPRPHHDAIPGDLLSVAQAAERLGTPVRFIRRLIAERRIRFYKVGRYVRLDAGDLDEFITAGRVDPQGR